MTMATVTYKRRMFPGQLLMAHPMAAFRVALELIATVKIDKNRGHPVQSGKLFFSDRYFFEAPPEGAVG